MFVEEYHPQDPTTLRAEERLLTQGVLRVLDEAFPRGFEQPQAPIDAKDLIAFPLPISHQDVIALMPSHWWGTDIVRIWPENSHRVSVFFSQALVFPLDKMIITQENGIDPLRGRAVSLTGHRWNTPLRDAENLLQVFDRQDPARQAHVDFLLYGDIIAVFLGFDAMVPSSHFPIYGSNIAKTEVY